MNLQVVEVTTNVYKIKWIRVRSFLFGLFKWTTVRWLKYDHDYGSHGIPKEWVSSFADGKIFDNSGTAIQYAEGIVHYHNVRNPNSQHPVIWRSTNETYNNYKDTFEKMRHLTNKLRIASENKDHDEEALILNELELVHQEMDNKH